MTVRVSSLPLFISYILFPAVFILTRNAGVELTRNWLDALALAIGLFALLTVIFRGKVRLHARFKLICAASVSFFAFIVILRFGSSFFYGLNAVPFVMELKPVVYLAVALLWVSAFGNISPRQFKSYGAWLGVIMVADLFLEAALAGHFVRPRGSGEPNYDAFLLLISLCVFFADDSKGQRGALVLIFIGLLATFSRTALVTAGVIVFIFSRIGVTKKVLLAVVCVLFVVLSFMLRDLPLDAIESMDRYWMWYSGIDLLVTHPNEAMWGFPAGARLPVDIPAALEWLWNSQQEGWGVSGVFPYHYHSFWLRAAITWGLVPVFLLLLASLMVLTGRKFPIYSKSLVLLIFLEGLTMGVFYLSNVALPLFFAIGLAISEGLLEPTQSAPGGALGAQQRA